jgi:prepilin-type N-terminal cleavage/methylation domain-containing protein
MKTKNYSSNKSTKNQVFAFKAQFVKSLKDTLSVQFAKEERGFTLIELLVSLVIGTALVSILLLFLNQILETNRREDAKSTSQQELQAALNYISDDLQEAIYIYDADGMEAIQAQIPYGNASTPALDPEKQPVLFFWKRYYYKPDEIVDGSKVDPPNSTNLVPKVDTPVACFTTGTAINASPPPGQSPCPFGAGIFSYSLVGYYIEKDTGAPATWSNAARLNRWEIREGFRDPTCAATATVCSYVNADPGYKKFDLNAPGKTISDKMYAWKRNFSAADQTATPWAIGAPAYNMGVTQLQEIVDFIDDTRYVPEIDDNDLAVPASINNFPVEVPIRPNSTTGFPTTAVQGNPNRVSNPDCANIAGTGVGSQRVLGNFNQRGSGGFNNNKLLTSFYACVNSPAGITNPSSVYPIARVYLRGNAFVRFADVNLTSRTFYPDVNTPPPTNIYRGRDLSKDTTIAPTSSVLVTGRGFLNPSP